MIFHFQANQHGHFLPTGRSMTSGSIAGNECGLLIGYSISNGRWAITHDEKDYWHNNENQGLHCFFPKTVQLGNIGCIYNNHKIMLVQKIKTNEGPCDLS